MRDTDRKAETQAEGEAGSMPCMEPASPSACVCLSLYLSPPMCVCVCVCDE